MSDVMIRLSVGGVLFDVKKSSLLRFKNTYFHGLLSSGAWYPDSDGVYNIDRPAMGFGRILEYLNSGKLAVDGLTPLEEECIYSNLDYFLIPYKRMIEGFMAHIICELNDGRICGAYEHDMIIWNLDTFIFEMNLIGHTSDINHIIQLHDGRVCSCSDTSTIKVWNIDNGVCDLTLTGNSADISYMIILYDGRLCSGSGDNHIRIWNVITLVIEMTIITESDICCVAQLSDERICCSDENCDFYVYSILTGECELSWEGHTDSVRTIICIDSIRILSGSEDCTIKVWNAATGECERTLEGHTDDVTSMVLMHDGRLCSASYDGTLKLWNLETGECENTLRCADHIGSGSGVYRVLQLSDGRFMATTNGHVWVLSYFEVK